MTLRDDVKSKAKVFQNLVSERDRAELILMYYIEEENFDKIMTWTERVNELNRLIDTYTYRVPIVGIRIWKFF